MALTITSSRHGVRAIGEVHAPGGALPPTHTALALFSLAFSGWQELYFLRSLLNMENNSNRTLQSICTYRAETQPAR